MSILGGRSWKGREGRRLGDGWNWEEMRVGKKTIYYQVALTIFDESKFEQVMDFDEIATSDPNLKIHFYVFKYNGSLEGTLETSEEIESFLWYDTSIKEDILSNTLKHKVIPYCIENNLIK